jgi:PKD repeat protein
MIFMNTSNSNNEPAEYVWDFGDGSTATSNNAEHTYEVAGHYIVCLTIFTANCSNTICEMVVVPGEAGTTLSLGGQVFAGNYNADLGSARLFLLDPVSMAVELIQTATLDSGSYLFTGLESGTYLIKAGLNENSEYYGNYVPTYFGSQYYWFDAQPVYLTENGFDYHISLIWAGNNGGPGWVNGDIDDGPYRIGGAAGASSAALVSNADVIVSDLSGNPQRFTISDVNGEFMIADLAFGTYRLMADVAGMVCIPVEFTISENTPNVSISLVMGDEITGLAETQETSLPVVYPNPAVEQFNIHLNLKQKETLNITITTTAGQLIRTESRTLSAGTQTLGVPVSDIANGIYFIRLLDANNKTIGVHKISVMH